MVSLNKASFNLRKTPSLQRNTLHSYRMEITSRADGFTGQRPNPDEAITLTGCRSWLFMVTSTKVDTGHLQYPVFGLDTAESGIGCINNRHLSRLAESNMVNVGDSYRNAKVSSPLMFDTRVGGVIVVGACESRAQGEGRQRVNAFLLER